MADVELESSSDLKTAFLTTEPHSCPLRKHHFLQILRATCRSWVSTSQWLWWKRTALSCQHIVIVHLTSGTDKIAQKFGFLLQGTKLEFERDLWRLDREAWLFPHRILSAFLQRSSLPGDCSPPSLIAWKEPFLDLSSWVFQTVPGKIVLWWAEKE